VPPRRGSDKVDMKSNVDAPWSAAAGAGSSGQIVFRSDVALVRVDAEAPIPSGPVSDLRRDTFRVADNGPEQTIVYFAHDEQPLVICSSTPPTACGPWQRASPRLPDWRWENSARRPGGHSGVPSWNHSCAARFGRLSGQLPGGFSNSMLRTDKLIEASLWPARLEMVRLTAGGRRGLAPGRVNPLTPPG
jgi:hypothetical protein